MGCWAYSKATRRRCCWTFENCAWGNWTSGGAWLRASLELHGRPGRHCPAQSWGAQSGARKRCPQGRELLVGPRAFVADLCLSAQRDDLGFVGSACPSCCSEPQVAWPASAPCVKLRWSERSSNTRPAITSSLPSKWCRTTKRHCPHAWPPVIDLSHLQSRVVYSHWLAPPTMVRNWLRVGRRLRG